MYTYVIILVKPHSNMVWSDDMISICYQVDCGLLDKPLKIYLLSMTQVTLLIDLDQVITILYYYGHLYMKETKIWNWFVIFFLEKDEQYI